MAFATYQGDVIIVSSTTFLGLLVLSMHVVAICCLLILLAGIIAGYTELPLRVRPSVIMVVVMALGALIPSLYACLADPAMSPVGAWYGYLIYPYVIMGAALCELGLLKIFTIVSSQMQAKDVTRIQIIFACIFQVGMVGHIANIFTHGNEPRWLANVIAFKLVENLWAVRKRGDGKWNRSHDKL